MTRLTRAGLLLAGTIAALLTTAAPAAAHGADAPNGSDYRTEVTAVTPADGQLRVRVVEAGARLELTNTGSEPVEVIGYSGEPYLRVGPDGVFENTRSPATYLNRTIAGDTVLPAEVDPAAAPNWRRVDDGPTARWHDQRTLWREAGPPAQVRAAPDREHRVRDWVVPLRAADGPREIRGTLDWVPPPDAYAWWVVVTLGALAVGAAGLLPAASRPGRRVLAGLGGLLICGGLAAVLLTVGRVRDAGADGVGAVLAGLLTGPVWPLLAGLAALAAGGWVIAGTAPRRTAVPVAGATLRPTATAAGARLPHGDFALAMVGACLALFAGVTNAAVFGRSVPPVPWPATAARLLVVVVMVAGAGALAAAVLRLHAAGRAARPAPAATAVDAARD
ncbi:hypothetical protein [Micromonospora endophytica]|uniref:Uncharacterized protein n=1 Tax=Micromonospora endophytica TaxID=515350 RepID=A0A2W2BSQ7_9ACTN|nr:hypothetical protein [Micromonospora endophytica]PZF89232.1 hypothetical protein C1I93_24150 [Micromonospora endophytica]RIW40541.1 hypothetical protein D3H59_29095 [Micromonospora endophytica]BCJ58233.1 hypothetical protein Jiend_16550 [Micromonospora endophytica]